MNPEHWLYTIPLRLRSLFRRRRADLELDDELRDHLARKTEDFIAKGMTTSEARRAALIELGGLEQTKENCRDTRRVNWIQDLLQDLRFGLRMLRRSPGFTTVAVLTLALGIGANTAIFSLIDAVMLRSLPVENPQQLVVLKWSARNAPKFHAYMSAGDCVTIRGGGNANPSGCAFSEPLFRQMAQANAFSGIAAFANAGLLNMTGNGAASLVNGQVASGDLFRTLGVKTAVGRVFQASDDLPSAAPVAVLNYGYWQSAFGGSRNAIGRTIELNNVPFTIIGVAEQRFTGITPGSDYDVWLPLSDAQRISPGKVRDSTGVHNRQDDTAFWWLTIVGRLEPKSSIAHTQAVVSGLFHNEMLYGSVTLFHSGETTATPPPTSQLAPQIGPARVDGKTFIGTSVLSKATDNPEITLVPAQSGLIGARSRYSDPLYVLMLAVGIILLIACANIAGLMFARAATRQKEMAVRLALGAGRTRIVRQLLTESVMLSVLGGILGILFAYWGARAIISFVSSTQTRPLGFAAGIDTRVLLFTVVVTLFTGILFGIAPAFRSVRIDLRPALKESEGSSANTGHARGKWFSIGNGLVVAQVALAVVVMVGAGLLVRTLKNLRSVDVGFDSHNIMVFGINPRLAGYEDNKVDSFYRDLRSRLAEMPAVKSVSYSTDAPLSGGVGETGFHWTGRPQDQELLTDWLGVGPGFFATLRIPLLLGRGFNSSDYVIAAASHRAMEQPTTGSASTLAPTPAIVDEAFVEKYLGRENPLERKFGDSPAKGDMPADPGYVIIGVVRDAKYDNLRSEFRPTMFTPQSGGGACFELSIVADPRAVLPQIRKALAQINANLPLFDVKTESEQIDRLLFQERLVARLSGFFGVLALVLACIGLYGLLAYEVSRRAHEIGIRMALGAQENLVMRLIVGQGARLAIIGIALGLAGALALTRFLQSMLFELKPTDPQTFAGVAILLLLVALAACYIPARRAMKFDPMVALRYE